MPRAHVLDPREGIDAPHDVLVRGGEIAEIAPPGSLEAPEGAEVLDGEGRHLLPGFVDPHVHLRTPGQEHKEDLDSGTRAAAAGGYVAVVAMPNTDPVVDSAPVLRSLREAARREARIPVGFMASITRGLDGEALTEMAELADAGALGFTDDGRPVHRAGILRKALQYQRLAGRILCLHEEDPTLSGRGVMHEGEVCARLGLAGMPSISESTLIARDASLAGYEGGRDPHPAPERPRVGRRDLRGEGPRRADHRRGDARTTSRSRTRRCCERLDTRLKMNPPLRAEDDRQALIAGLLDGTIDCIATDHAPHAREEKEVPFEEAPMGTTGLETAFAAVYTELVLPGVLPLALVVDKLSSRRRAPGAAAAGDPPRRARERLPARPRGRVGGRRGGLREPLGELLLRRPPAARARARHGRGGRRRLPPRTLSVVGAA